MSEKSACHELREQIWLLDAQFEIREPREPKDSNPVNAVQRLRQCEAPYLREIYLTGHITRPSLARHWEPSRPVEIPAEILESLGTDSAKTAPKIPSELLHELLWPKRKRGRPRNEALQALVKLQKCSDRHARRLLAFGKQRERVREHLRPSEEWALQQRAKRAELVRDLKENELRDDLARVLDVLTRGWERVWLSSSVSPQARELAKQMVDARGIETALLICGFALGEIDLRFASKTLGVSRSTIYRRFRGRLTWLKTRGKDLATTLPSADLSKVVDAPLLVKRRYSDTEENENAWAMQTTFSPENFRAAYY